ncbi:TFIIH basal transcription factor complex helicase XPD subunit [Thelohanellus kitauei]|uniref:General transcription and DNA repair factor IIH helicase subunit XPD n=1 Tax=Thelohanellus kitauei TaxID=669202 RepID=A0A0C2N678_THEKT|nr:TFIIH basal transcription factor complex helicase XPD subunit [Thelohanellus kitauei]
MDFLKLYGILWRVLGTMETSAMIEFTVTQTQQIMKFEIDGLAVLFPYETIYPEQYQYMTYLKQTLDAGGNSVLEMPSGTGKTVSLLSLIISYMTQNPAKYSKLIYCTRTVSEIEKVLDEVSRLNDYYKKTQQNYVDFLSICLSSRKNLCINESVCGVDAREVDRKCHTLTSSTTRAKANETGVELCDYFENFEKDGRGYSVPAGVYKLDKWKEFARQKQWCPYFLARQSVIECKILVYSYAYLIDPKVAGIVSKEIESSSIVIFDEAHNIDSACIEAFSVTLDQSIIIGCREALELVADKLSNVKLSNREKLESEYSLLLEGLQKLRTTQNKDFFLPNPVISQEILEEAVPGNIRKSEHFLSFMTRFVEYVAFKMNLNYLVVETPATFLSHVQEHAGIDKRALRFCSERLRSLLAVLELDNRPNISSPLGVVASFGTIVSSNEKGFCVVTEPFDPASPNIPRPKVYLNCMDASLTIKPVFDRFKCIIITSGTLSPLDMYPRLLNFRPCILASLTVSVARQNILPLIVTRGADQCVISTRFSDRMEPAVIRNYGMLVAEVCKSVSDGVVCFFTSYRHMEAAIASWNDTGLISRIQSSKLIFVETPNFEETNLALNGYRRACECGRGGLLFSIARGKVSEGIDFYDHLGRAVIVIGIPYVFTLSSTLRARLDYLRDT